MGMQDFLKGFKPQINDDGDLPVKGTAETKVNHLRLSKNRDGVFDRYELELETVAVIEGDIRVGKRFWRRYFKDNEESVKDLVNDMFTAGIDLELQGDQSVFEASFDKAIGKPVIVRAWGWTPEKDKQGNILPADQRKPIQQFVIKHKAGVKAGKGGKGSPAPF